MKEKWFVLIIMVLISGLVGTDVLGQLQDSGYKELIQKDRSKIFDSNTENATARIWTRSISIGNIYYASLFHKDYGRELWRSDGTKKGTYMVKDINPGPNHSLYSQETLKTAGDILYLCADDGLNGKRLWRSDGTEKGTYMIKDINRGGRRSDCNQMTAIGNTLFFTAKDRKNGYQIWKSDGTKAGTKRLSYQP